MKFFVPEVSEAHTESVYNTLIDAAKNQMKTTITPRRIYGLKYVHDKRPIRLAVGDPHPEHLGYVVLAILESHPFIVVAQSTRGGSDLMILVNGTEVTETIEFD